MFISKKQRQQIKERRRKKLKGLEQPTSPTATRTKDKYTTNNNNSDDVDEGVAFEEINNQQSNACGFKQLSARLESSNSTKPLILEEEEMKKRKSKNKENGPLASAEITASGKRVVLVRSHLTAKDAKKFRKEIRRHARSIGLKDDDVEFRTENGQMSSSAAAKSSCSSTTLPEITDGNAKINHSKKRKREFPKINQILQDEKARTEKRVKQEAQRQADAKISDDIKDRYRAVDCEMVGIGSDGKISVLARVSVTDWSGAVLLDTFVKVPSKVSDFRTQWSGVAAHHLKSDKAMDTNECRSKVAALLKGKVLVGHALKNDLDALFLTHPKEDIRDTAKYRPFQRQNGKKWQPRKLRDLVKEHCDIDIQRKGESHDSVDDARAAMELFKVARIVWEAELDRKAKKNILQRRK